MKAIQAGELIKLESEKDKEFHFQNWFRSRLKKLRLNFDEPGRNTYPDFRLVKFTEGYEVKELKWPGRDSTYPSRTIRYIVGYTPGGTADMLARAVGQKFNEAWGHQVLVENRPGGGTNIATEIAAKSPPDGYTLFMPTVANAINPTLYPKLGYDPIRDFVNIINKLHTEAVRAIAARDIRDRMSAEGAEFVGDTPEQFTAFFKAEIVKWGKAVKASGAKVD